MSRTKRPHPNELPAPTETQGLAWLTADRTDTDEADQMQRLWDHYRKRTTPRTAPTALPHQRDGPKKG